MAFALDIEAINTVSPPEFDNPAGWDPFAIGLSYLDESAPDSTETVVLFREGDTPEDLQRLLERAITWLHKRATPDEALYTYNGTDFDLPILKECALELGAKPPYAPTARRLHALLSLLDHRDLFDDMISELSEGDRWLSLDACYEAHGVAVHSPPDAPTGADMPAMGRKIIAGGKDANRVKHRVRPYVVADVAPLFDLAAQYGHGTPAPGTHLAEPEHTHTQIDQAVSSERD